jgi:hypothetical protein
MRICFGHNIPRVNTVFGSVLYRKCVFYMYVVFYECILISEELMDCVSANLLEVVQKIDL